LHLIFLFLPILKVFSAKTPLIDIFRPVRYNELVSNFELFSRQEALFLFRCVIQCYESFRLLSYQGLFRLLRERDGSLSASEAYAVDVIYLLRGPTVKQFADCIGISQPNATYKVNNLIQKGYIRKTPSPEDRREAHLHVTEKFMRYCTESDGALARAVRSLKERFSPEELRAFARVLQTLTELISKTEKPRGAELGENA